MADDLHIDTIGDLEAVVNGVLHPSTVVIFVHGIPGHKDVGQLRDASCELVVERLATTVRYSMERDKRKEQKIGNSWQRNFLLLKSLALIGAYSGTYADAQAELGRVVEFIQQELRPESLYLSAHSFGAGLAVLATPQIPNLAGVLLSNPLISLGWRKLFSWGHPEKSKGRFRGFPQEEQFLDSIQNYNGKVWIVHSERDRIVSPKNTKNLYDAAKPERRRLITIPGSDHDFLGESRKRYVQAHVDFLKD